MIRTDLKSVINESGVRFGTSGVRALATDLTDYICYCYVVAFINFLRTSGKFDTSLVAIAGDYRETTPRITNAVASALNNMDIKIINCGNIPTPALTFFGVQKQIPTIMITGSHITSDRNGIKFNKPDGEIMKEDENIISSQTIEVEENLFDEHGNLKILTHIPEVNFEAERIYLQRYIDFFPAKFLQSKKIGVYGHSSVSRKLLCDLLENFGAIIQQIEFSDKFVAIDTEAVDSTFEQNAKKWVVDFDLDWIVSTDGDGDRPLITDEKGKLTRPDVLGILTGKYLEVEAIVTAITSNTSLEKSRYFQKVERTKVGSPYVIERMNQLRSTFELVGGYEANGGFFCGSDINKEGRILKALPSRDAIIVILSILHSSVLQNKPVSRLLSELPERYTFSGEIKGVTKESGAEILQKLFDRQYLGILPKELLSISIKSTDLTDGVRLVFENEEILHFRQSGNAPELRVYSESDTEDSAKRIVDQSIMNLKQLLN
jgi:phosphomannomutase